ncbi:MAG TPA: hypothetical protein VIF15_07220 [Polyangiaceae bacterium]|jgi:hypothetical protein
MTRATARAAWLAVAALSLGVQCQSQPAVTFEILLPSSVADQAQWMEIGVLAGACPLPSQLAAGIPPSGTVARVAFMKGDTSPPPIGSLAKATYAFAAAARGADCGVLATGCTTADLTSAHDVSIPLAATPAPTGACGAGETCAGGRCAPALGGGATNLGAGCSMELVGAGPLGDPLELSGSDVASAPAIAISERGFLVAYREYDQLQGAARLTVAEVDPGGGLTIAPTTTLAAQCPDQDEGDGVAISYFGASGVVASARPACGAQQAGVDLMQIDGGGAVLQSAFEVTAGGKAAISNAHGLALTGASSGWLAYLDAQGAAGAVALSGLLTQGSPTPFGGGPPATLAQVVSTNQMLALLAAGPGPTGDAGAGGPTLRLQLGASPSSTSLPMVLGGTWGALAAEGARAFVLSDAGAGGKPVAWHAFDLGGPSAVATDSFAPPGAGAVLGGDVAFRLDRVMFVLEQAGALSVAVYDHASTTPTPLRSVLLSGDARVPSQATVRDGRVAIAASDSRVLVAWLTAKTIGPNDPLGGYALYACAP